MNLTTPRLLLRPFQPDDFPALRALDEIPEMWRYRGTTEVTEEQSRKRFERKLLAATEEQPQRHFPFAIIHDGQMIGNCSLKIHDREAGLGEIGYALAPAFWRQGYITEAGQALLAFGFTTLGLHRIAAICITENIGSWGVMQKLGMRREGHFLEVERINDVWYDHYLYAILDREWLNRSSDGT